MARHAVEKEMKRLFVDKIDTVVTLTGDTHKYLSVVLRAKMGDEVILCVGDGYDCVCKVSEIRKDKTVLMLCERVKNDSEPSVDITLFSAIMKGDKNELVVQKAVELGVKEIYPLHTRFVQNFDRNIKTDRLNKIALEASQQCGRSVLAKVHEPIDFSRLLDMVKEFDLVVYPYERATSPSIKDYLTANAHSGDIKSVAIVIGSEGGFSEEEAASLAGAGVIPLTLGKRILRAETANIAVLSAVMYELEQWQ